jgi:hypothetical protein
MPVNEERVALGIAALRSGEYKRGKGTLHRISARGEETWCCLGVFTDAAIRAGADIPRAIVPEGEQSAEKFGDQVNEFFCRQAEEWFGFGSVDPLLHGENDAGDTWEIPASDWNDQGIPGEDAPREDFLDIADAFELTYITTKDTE